MKHLYYGFGIKRRKSAIKYTGICGLKKLFMFCYYFFIGIYDKCYKFMSKYKKVKIRVKNGGNVSRE